MRWEKVEYWSTIAAISLKRKETLLWRAYRKSPTLFRFFGSPPYFYFRFCVYGHQDGRYCLIFARIAQQLVLDGTNGLSSSKPCAFCRIVWSELKPEVVLATIIRHLHPRSFEWVEWRIVRREVYSTRVSETAKVMHFKFSVHIQKLSGQSYVRCIERSSLR